MKNKKNLGLENLFGKDFKNLVKEIEKNENKQSIIEIDVDKIKPNPFQPRKKFDKKDLNELANSIKENGLISPIALIRKEGEYLIISGERRYRAHKILKLKKIKSIIFDIPIDKIEELSIIENIQRKQLDPIEEAIAIKSLSINKKMSHQEISHNLGKSRSYVTNSLRLLTLDEKVIKEIQNNNLSVGQVRSMIGLEKNKQLDIMGLILKNNLNSREVEKLIRNIKTNKNSKNDFNDFIKIEYIDKIKILNSKVIINFKDQKELIEILKKLDLYNDKKE